MLQHGIHVTVTGVLGIRGRIVLLLVGEDSGKDPDGFGLMMFQDVINLNIVPAMTWDLIMIDLAMLNASMAHIQAEDVIVKEAGLEIVVVTVGILLYILRIFNPIYIS